MRATCWLSVTDDPDALCGCMSLRTRRWPSERKATNGALTGWMRAHGSRLVAVRPDVFVAASGLAVPARAAQLF